MLPAAIPSVSTWERPEEGGFTLMEALVALALFSSVFILLNQGLSSSWQGKRRADQEVSAVALATSVLASAGVETPLIGGNQTTGQRGAFNWELLVEPYLEPNAQSAPELFTSAPLASAPNTGPARPTDGSAIAAYWVDVDVTWSNGPLQKPRMLRLRTLKLGRT